MFREIEIYSTLKRPEKDKFYDPVDTTRITEQAGYIPPRIQIEQFMIAGQRLAQYRKEMFDFGYGEPVDEGFVDPTRKPGFDLADGAELMNGIEAKRAAMKARVSKSNESVATEDKINP